MISKPFDKIDLADIEDLIEQEVSEKRTLDYKEKLPGKGTDEKRELANDVSSFANAAGGDIIYGVSEKLENGKKTGLPDEIVAISGDETGDEAIRRIECVIRANISPPPRVQTKEIPVSGGYILLLRVPQSFSAPHMVKTQQSTRFFSRSSNGKHQLLDVHEIRNAFVASEAITDRMQQFHQNRLAKVVANEGPATYLVDAPRIVLHILPISAFGRPQASRLTTGGLLSVGSCFHPPVGWSGSRINCDGLLCPYSVANEPTACFAYCQVFFNGIVESVDAFHFQPGTSAHLLIDKFEAETVRAVDRYLWGLRHLGIEPPVLILAAVLGAKGCFMQRDVLPFTERRSPIPIDRNNVVLPDVLIEEFDEAPASTNNNQMRYASDQLQFAATAIRPIIDGIWNAAGHPGSHHYDKNGYWSGADNF